MRAGAILLIALTSASMALMQAYSVEPIKAAWSGWTRTILGQDTISQTITCNFDSIVYCELFVGDLGANPGNNPYRVDVYEVGSGVDPVAWGPDTTASKGHTWLKMPLTTETGYKFTKGKVYEFRFTRSGSDSIQYYYDLEDPYPYGSMPGDHAPNNADLAMRVYGVMDAVDSSWFSSSPFIVSSFV